jgi:hypothetical protein
MLKKNLILCLLLFFYSIVLAHNAVPHGHFDELSSSEHDSDSHHHGEHSSHDHHYLFSHSISLHVTLDKQISFSTIQSKTESKSFPKTTFCLSTDSQIFTPPASWMTLFYCVVKSPTPTCSNSPFNRGPPIPL